MPPAYRYISEPAAAEGAFRSLAGETAIAFAGVLGIRQQLFFVLFRRD